MPERMLAGFGSDDTYKELLAKFLRKNRYKTAGLDLGFKMARADLEHPLDDYPPLEM
jgi:hypothetical protein